MAIITIIIIISATTIMTISVIISPSSATTSSTAGLNPLHMVTLMHADVFIVTVSTDAYVSAQQAYGFIAV